MSTRTPYGKRYTEPTTPESYTSNQSVNTIVSLFGKTAAPLDTHANVHSNATDIMRKPPAESTTVARLAAETKTGISMAPSRSVSGVLGVTTAGAQIETDILVANKTGIRVISTANPKAGTNVAAATATRLANDSKQRVITGRGFTGVTTTATKPVITAPPKIEDQNDKVSNVITPPGLNKETSTKKHSGGSENQAFTTMATTTAINITTATTPTTTITTTKASDATSSTVGTSTTTAVTLQTHINSEPITNSSATQYSTSNKVETTPNQTSIQIMGTTMGTANMSITNTTNTKTNSTTSASGLVPSLITNTTTNNYTSLATVSANESTSTFITSPLGNATSNFLTKTKAKPTSTISRITYTTSSHTSSLQSSTETSSHITTTTRVTGDTTRVSQMNHVTNTTSNVTNSLFTYTTRSPTSSMINNTTPKSTISLVAYTTSLPTSSLVTNATNQFISSNNSNATSATSLITNTTSNGTSSVSTFTTTLPANSTITTAATKPTFINFNVTSPNNSSQNNTTATGISSLTTYPSTSPTTSPITSSYAAHRTNNFTLATDLPPDNMQNPVTILTMNTTAKEATRFPINTTNPTSLDVKVTSPGENYRTVDSAVLMLRMNSCTPVDNNTVKTIDAIIEKTCSIFSHRFGIKAVTLTFRGNTKSVSCSSVLFSQQ
ncbi:hypothetical protein XELAEV_18034069mg [Xenopus laevis]|uniref:Uncharacterized protein n=1 Tax=Xenopus laevis TaxID=8355 RepID=A0A974HEK2_XENLA|nr:hypothetical protein XELAEV_18034069mg [Xenopus laevis]